jgi:hypothetical protein
VQAHALNLHEADGAWIGWIRNVVDPHAGGEVLTALAVAGGIDLIRAAVIVLL